MTIPTVQQYKDVIANDVLLPRQLEALKLLYEFPNSSATATQLAKVADPGRHSVSITSFRIGKIGKRIADYCQIVPPTYFIRSKNRPAYSTLVSAEYHKTLGWTMYENLKRALEELHLVEKTNSDTLYDRLPTEAMSFNESLLLTEGKVVKVFVDKYERNLKARIACIEHFGHKCFACQFDFGLFYGKLADGYIHVHHIVSLSEIGQEYIVDPIKDLIPLCPNCHSVVHLSRPPLTINELKELVQKNGR